jgi:hypothetical protein
MKHEGHRLFDWQRELIKEANPYLSAEITQMRFDIFA